MNCREIFTNHFAAIILVNYRLAHKVHTIALKHYKRSIWAAQDPNKQVTCKLNCTGIYPFGL